MTYWDKQGVDVFPMTLQEYIPGLQAALNSRIAKMPGAAPAQ
jgi:ethanolamine utilization microcompartment shell protein EutS